MSGLSSAATGRSYGLARVCRAWGIARATVYRQRQRDPAAPQRRPGPLGPCDDATLLGHLRALIETSRFHGEGHRKLWARLRFAGIRTSMRRVRRLMRENQLLAPYRVGRAKSKAHAGTIITPAVDQMWGTDMTPTVTVRDGPAYVFVAVDHGNTVTPSASASMPTAAAIASKRWNRSAKASCGPSVPLRTTWPPVCSSVTTMDRITWPMTFKRRAPSLASPARPASCASPRAMVWPSASSER